MTQAPQGIHYLDAVGPPGMRLFAIGDVHGRLDLLEEMHRRIADDLATDPPDDWRIIHLGDYVDRGPNSKGVIDFIRRARHADARMIALCGNHDEGMAEFLGRPEKDSLFALYGGRQTALSYGVHADFSSAWLVRQVADELLAAMPDGQIEFLTDLPRSCTFGDFFFCHAGIRPGVPLDRQDPNDLIWIRREFLDWTGLHPKIIVHGHTPHSAPQIMPNRVNVDTEAWRSGVLTALLIDGNRKKILQVGL